MISLLIQVDCCYRNGGSKYFGNRRYIVGAPDLIVEILSPSNPDHDRRTKYYLYAEAGVREYWLVDAENCTVEVHVLRGNAYVPYGHFGPGDLITSEEMNDLQIAVDAICTLE